MEIVYCNYFYISFLCYNYPNICIPFTLVYYTFKYYHYPYCFVYSLQTNFIPRTITSLICTFARYCRLSMLMEFTFTHSRQNLRSPSKSKPWPVGERNSSRNLLIKSASETSAVGWSTHKRKGNGIHTLWQVYFILLMIPHWNVRG